MVTVNRACTIHCLRKVSWAGSRAWNLLHAIGPMAVEVRHNYHLLQNLIACGMGLPTASATVATSRAAVSTVPAAGLEGCIGVKGNLMISAGSVLSPASWTLTTDSCGEAANSLLCSNGAYSPKSTAESASDSDRYTGSTMLLAWTFSSAGAADLCGLAVLGTSEAFAGSMTALVTSGSLLGICAVLCSFCQ